MPRYELSAGQSMMTFDFTSEGPKGQISKLIKFSETTIEGVYNLAFGDMSFENEDIDDVIVSNNGDSDKVLATVVAAVFLFTNNKKEVWVYATGSTKSRTRLYRMGITKYIDEIKNDFLVFGLKDDEWESFEKEVEYTAFVVKRK